MYSKTGCGKAYERCVGSAPKSTERLWLFQSPGGPNLRASSPRLGCGRGWFSSGRPCRALKFPPPPGIQASSDSPTRQTSAVGFTGLVSPRAPDYPPLRFVLWFRGAQPNTKYPCGPHSTCRREWPAAALRRWPGTRLKPFAGLPVLAGRGLAHLANARGSRCHFVSPTACGRRHLPHHLSPASG